MKKLLCILTFATVASQTVAAPKRLLCEGEATNAAKDKFIIEVILDTDDFAKESPQAEVTLRSWMLDGVQASRELFKGILTPATGKTYRMPYSVTTTILSVTARVTIEGSKYNERTFDISRKDLSLEYGKCTIEDYSVDNAI